MKERLYYQNPYLKEFTAAVVERGSEADGTFYIVLDQTAFYPTGGGQPCDLGTINDCEVIDVEEVDRQIRHRLRSALPVEVDSVIGKIDWDRRFDHMQQHTGQHILSAAFEQLFQVATDGFHLGRERVTIDLVTGELTEEMIRQAVFLANRIAYENRPIAASFMEPEQLAQLPLSKPPSVTENIRIVTIEDFDYNPCGGTHPARTGEAGPIQIIGWERSKGNIRVSFVCGLRVANEYHTKHTILQQLTRLTSSLENELPDHVAKLMAERKELEKTVVELQGRLLEAEAKELLEQRETHGEWQLILIPFKNRPMADLQKLAQLLVAPLPKGIAILVSQGPKTQMVFARGAQVALAMNGLLQEALRLVDGKGGGQPAIAQGGGSSSLSADELLVHIRQILLAKLDERKGV